jgi:tripartite ATP-independent transporter DctP family solute receptor
MGAGQGEGEEKAEDKVYNIKFASAVPDGVPAAKAMKQVAEKVKERSGGKLLIEVFTDGQLGNERDAAEAVRVGAIEMSHNSLGSLAIFDESLNVFALPYIWKSADHLIEAVRGEIGKETFEKFEQKTGIKILDAGWIWGVRHLTTKGIEVTKPEDIAGVKVRAPEIPLYVDMVKSWGALPVAVQSNDIYMALQTGMAKGQENPITAIYQWKLYEVQDYLILTGHMIQTNPVSINSDFFNSLPEEYQKILTEEVIAAGDYNNQVIAESDEESKKKMVADGLKVIDPDYDAFLEATQKMHGKYMWLVTQI